MSDFFTKILDKNPEELSLCLPVRNAYGEIVKNICTNLAEFPCYLLHNGVDDFFRATIIKEFGAPLDWQFVEDFAWAERKADQKISEDEQEIVLKRFVMNIRGSDFLRFL